MSERKIKKSIYEYLNQYNFEYFQTPQINEIILNSHGNWGHFNVTKLYKGQYILEVNPLLFDQNNGFDPELSLFIMLKNAKKINGAGTYLYIGDRDDIKFSQKTFKDKLKELPELREVFIKEVISLLKEDLDSSDKEDSAVQRDYSLATDIISSLNDSMPTA